MFGEYVAGRFGVQEIAKRPRLLEKNEEKSHTIWSQKDDQGGP
jgi:hypothetical protein